MENIIKINKLGYNYGEGWILHDLSVEIAQDVYKRQGHMF